MDELAAELLANICNAYHQVLIDEELTELYREKFKNSTDLATAALFMDILGRK